MLIFCIIAVFQISLVRYMPFQLVFSHLQISVKKEPLYIDVEIQICCMRFLNSILIPTVKGNRCILNNMLFRLQLFNVE